MPQQGHIMLFYSDATISRITENIKTAIARDGLPEPSSSEIRLYAHEESSRPNHSNSAIKNNKRKKS